MSQLLQYTYAIINEVGYCEGVITSSVEVPLDTYILIPELNDDYYGKYYNINGDQMWYHDAAFTQLWEECPSHNM